MEGGNCKAMLLWVALLAMPLVVCCDFNPASELGHWSFDNTLADVSAAKRAAAVIVGSNVALAQDKDIAGECGRGGYVRIRQPGYLNLPAVRLYDTSFTITFTLRIPSYPTSNQVLFADWSTNQWQFWSFIEADSRTIVLNMRRNIWFGGSNPEQDLLFIHSGTIPVGSWFDVALQFDRQTRTAKIFLDQKLSSTVVVRNSVVDVTLWNSNSNLYQFGRKADESGDAWALAADVRNLRIFGSALAP